jgi:DNA-binding LytR/AlgR family response regulator
MERKIKCILLDDELPGLTYLKMLCEQLPELEIVKSYNNPTLFLSEIQQHDFDVCFMDIEMPDINGLQLAQVVKGKHIIFITAYKDYAADAFDLNAIDYIRKPYNKARLQQSIDKLKKAERPVKVNPKTIQLNTDKGKVKLNLNEIIFVRASEIDSRDKRIQLTSERTLIAKNISFDKLLEQIPDDQFCRINKKEVISLDHVAHFSFDEISIYLNLEHTKTITLQLSETFRKEFISRYSD